MERRHIDGILNLWWFPPDGFAPAMMEHIQAFGRYSGHQVYSWNTAYGQPDFLKDVEFSAINLHYSLFGGPIHWIDAPWREYVASMKNAFKIALFQDEYRFWGLRYELLEALPLDLVYTCLEPQWHQDTYYKHGWKGKAVYALTGYVGDDMVRLAQTHALPEGQRTVDIGYRARRLEEYMGRGAMEKHLIADGMLEHAGRNNLHLDVSTREEDRVYGDGWYAFLGNCKGCIGVEAGVSVVDTDDVLWPLWRRMSDANPGLDFETFSRAAGLERWEGVPSYRMLSPRHFECAAMDVCQILFEGEYSGVMSPGVHYIELKKDFSNIDRVLDEFADTDRRSELTRNARHDLIESGKYHFREYLRDFSGELKEVGVLPAPRRDTVLDGLLQEAEAQGRARYANSGEWIGPHLHQRPNWPENLAHLRDKELSINQAGELVVVSRG